MRAYPTLSPYSAARIAVEFCAIERMTKLHAERQCNDADYQAEGANGEPMPRFARGARAIERAIAIVTNNIRYWQNLTGSKGMQIREASYALFDFETGGDPRGATFKVRLPSEKELVAV
jgi:hypothetical protein